MLLSLQLHATMTRAHREALVALYDAHAVHVFRNLRALGVRDADLDDQVHEVFLVAARQLDRYEERGTSAAWLHAIAVRVAAGYRRRAHHRLERPDDRMDIRAGEAEVEQRAVAREALGRLATGLERIDERARAAFVLAKLEGLDMKDVARTLDCGLSTAYKAVERARRSLVEFVRDGGTAARKGARR